ncbi:hypothetical protein G6F43_003711 [Rhizopus delemar]|nr:hypothetical protein G6F43_003711 [Rhizopus delemar]
MKYWLFNVRKTNDDVQPDILGLSPTTTFATGSGTSVEQLNHDMHGIIDPEHKSPSTSLFERLLPIQFECTKSAILIGNMDLKTALIVQIVEANGIYSITKSRSPMDYYKATVDFALRKPQISLKDNIDFNQGQSTDNEKKESGRSSTENTTFHDEYARVSNIFECNEAILTYYMDYAGPVPNAPSDSDIIGNGGIPPEWGIRISLWDATIHYGPWADRQRAEMQDYFFPPSHRNNVPTPKLMPGQSRLATQFETYIEFMNDGKLRVPTREKSKDWKYTLGTPDLDISPDGYYTRPYGWFNIKAGEGSFVKIITPMIYGPEGSISTIDVVLKETDITTSVNYASFVLSHRIEIQCRMPAPLQWNGFRQWDFKITPKRATVFLLRDHIYLLQDTMKDWGSTPQPDLLHFTPTTYQLQFLLEHPIVYLCVNEHNVINNPNSIEDNAFLKLQAQKIKVDTFMPFVEFQPETTAIKFNVKIDQGSAGLSLQTSHTLSAFMNEDDARTASVVQMSIDGSYEAYNEVDIARHIESCNLHIKLNGAKVKLFGTLIRYILLLKDNYFGDWDNFSTIDEYRDQRENHREWLAQKKRQADSKPTVDPFEVYVLVELEDGVMLLPENLYECSRYSQVEFQELQVELRNLDVYMDFYVNISPITLSRNINTNNQPNEEYFRAKRIRDTKNSVFIDGLNIYSHRLFGPLPLSSTYLCHYELDIGRITGEVKPSFLLGLACFGQSFAYNLIDEDNAVPPELRSASLPDVTFAKVSVQEIDVCLVSLNSATNIQLSDGILLEFDNLINQKYTERITLKIPSILTRCLANAEYTRSDGAENDYPWAEVAKADLSLNITLLRHTAEWKKRRTEQQNYIRSQDYLTQRCVRLYEEEDDYISQHSKSSAPSANDHHVGILYAPPFRAFISGRVDDKSIHLDGNTADTNFSTDTVKNMGRFRGYSNSSSMSRRSVVLVESDSDSILSNSDDDNDILSIKSAISRDNDSFHTAKDSDDEYDFDQSEITEDEYSVQSEITDLLSSEDEQSAHINGTYTLPQASEKNLPSVIPPSIPYSDYLRRYKIDRSNCRLSHPFIPPSRPQIVPEKDQEERRYFRYRDTSSTMKDYFSQEFDNNREKERTNASVNEKEVVATTVIEATRPVTVLVTPILVKIVQELAEEIIKDDWDLETMLDALQMEYVEQLTRYLTDQYICTRFAVVLPETYLHFIQNVTVPDDLPSYKHGSSIVKTRYNTEDTVLCSADIFMNNFQMIGSIKVEDYAFDERKKKVAESKIVLQESRVHIHTDEIGATVQYVSKKYERQTIVFGIPYQHLHNKKLYEGQDQSTLVNELVMLDLALKGFDFKWLGARTPNYAELLVTSLDTIIITESVEVLVGAVYSWLVFVDDFKGILQMFQDQRSRQVQVFINELADFSISPCVTGDPLFLTTPTTMLRLGSRNFRTDVGWKLLARMRHCLRSMPGSIRDKLQHRLTSGNTLKNIDSNAMFNNVVRSLSIWRGWEIGTEDIKHCRLFTQPFKQKTFSEDDETKSNMTNEIVKFLISSSNFAKFRLGQFNFVIYEEELEEKGKDENKISIQPVEFSLECLYKSSPISLVPEGHHAQDEPSKLSAALDGYLDIVAKLDIGEVQISTNPIILAFARHMLMVQRVFTAKLRHLPSNNTQKAIHNHPAETSSSIKSSQIMFDEPSEEFDFDALLSKVDIVAQALCNLEKIKLTAHAQELKMDTIISGVQGSILFSNPKLSPLQLVSHLDKDSDAGSGRRSSNRASRRTANSGPRLVLETAGGIDCIDIKFKEEQKRNNLEPCYNTLLAVSLSKANLNANVSQITKSSRKQGKSDNPKHILNIFSNIHKFDIHVPQSLLRLYGFVESWQTEQGRRYHFMLQNLLKEWEEKRRNVFAHSHTIHEESSATTTILKKPDIKLQFLLNEFMVQADLLPSLSVEYSVLDFFVMVNETQQKAVPVHMYAFQLSEQAIHLITKHAKQGSSKHLESTNTSTFSIPGIRSTGSLRSEMIDDVNQLRLRSMISVDLVSMSLDASLIDSLLTAQSLVGSEVSELLEVLSYSKNKQNAAEVTSVTTDTDASLSTAITNRKFKYTVDISLDGLRISATSPSAIGIFHSNLLEASISNDRIENSDQLAWKIQAGNFSLSLDHNMADTVNQHEESIVYRRNCLAYILVDFSIQNYPPQCSNENCDIISHCHGRDRELESLFIEFIKIQTVMQPIALGKLADMYIHYEQELTKKKMMKKDELDRLSTNTKRLVQTISTKNEWPNAFQEEPHSILEGKIISLRVRCLGVAIPLDEQSDIPLPSICKNVSALLFSVGCIDFFTKNIENSTLRLENMALQFVKHFDQSKSEHFLADNHSRMNQISLPLIYCHVSASNVKHIQAITVNAQVGGFEVDVDGTIVDYINTLSVIYMKSMDRVDAFTAEAKFKTKPSQLPSTPEYVDTSAQTEVVHLNVECKLECQTGTVRMYPKRHSQHTYKNSNRSQGLRIRTGFDPKVGEGNMATIHLPGLLARITCQIPLGAHAPVTDLSKRLHADVLICESTNTLHPALVLFLHEVSAGLKFGIQQSSERKADKGTQAEIDANLNASLLLRLSKTHLDLSCQPNSKVVCSLGWEESEFLINTFSKDTTSRTISCIGSLKTITTMVKHHFSPEACFHAKIDRTIFNAVLTSQRKDGDKSDDISISVDLPEILGYLNMRHLQDLLVLYNCWLVQPLMQEHKKEASQLHAPLHVFKPNDQTLDHIKTNEKIESLLVQSTFAEQTPVPFSKHIAVRFKKLELGVDLGQAIGKITLIPENLLLQAHHVPFESKGLSFSLDNIHIEAEGRLTGSGLIKPIIIKARIDQSNVTNGLNAKSVAYVRSEGFEATLEYEYQNILDCVQRSIEFTAELERVDDKYNLQVSIILEALLARLSIKTVPVILTMIQKFNELLEKKKLEAGIPSSKSNMLQVSDSDAVYTEQVLKSKKKNHYGSSLVHSRVDLHIHALEVVIYPSQFQDSDNVDIRAKQFVINLEEQPPTEEGVHRKLIITLNGAALAKNVPGLELVPRYKDSASMGASTPKNLGGTKIFGIPGTEINMESTQLESSITHEFDAVFAGRVSVSLNIGLIKQLQEMINMFNIQISRVLDKQSEKMQIFGDPSTPLSTSSVLEESEDNNSITNSRKPSLVIGTPHSQRNELISDTSDYQEIAVEEEPHMFTKIGAPEKEETPNIEISKAEKYQYKSLNSVNFQPQLQVMGDATPPVEWLGLKRERIPGLVHENITLHLNRLVQALWGLLESQTQ